MIKEKFCLRCGCKLNTETKWCEKCRKQNKKEYMKKKHERDGRYFYGYSRCSICKKKMKMYNKNQVTHLKCQHLLSLALSKNKYQQLKRDNRGKMISVNVVEQHGIKIPKNHVVHHLDCNPNNNDIKNLFILKCSDHAKLHALLRSEYAKWLKNKKYQKWNINQIKKETFKIIEKHSINIMYCCDYMPV